MFTFDTAASVVVPADHSLAEEAERRSSVIREALSWLGTSFRDNQQAKGQGCDCGGFVNGVFAACGFEHEQYRDYKPQWFRNSDDEMYLNAMRSRAEEVAVASPGDVALFKFGRVYGHGAIVLDWPRVIHSFRPNGVCIGDASRPPLLRPRQYPVLFFSPYSKP